MAAAAPMLMPNSAIGPMPAALEEGDGRGDVAALVRPQGDRARPALAVAAEVELEDVMALVEPGHEPGELRQAVAGEAVHDDDGGRRLAARRG